MRDDRVSRKKARIKAMLHLAAEDAKAAKLLAQAGSGSSRPGGIKDRA